MHNKVLVRVIRTTISDIIVVLLFLLIIINVFNYYAKEKIDNIFKTINFMSIKADVVEEEDVKIEINEVEKKLTHYPYYGEQYGNVKIESIGVDLPLFYGDSLEILKNGIGHSVESYFPGEGGTVIMCEHNYMNLFYVWDIIIKQCLENFQNWN